MNRPCDPSASKGRILWIDAFRAFLIFAIAMGHAVSDVSRPGILLNEYLYSFHVPAFFLISGYLFKKKKESFLAFAVKRAKGLLLPYLIFAVISILIFAVLGAVASEGLGVGVKTTGLFPSVLGMLYANGVTGYMAWNLPLWFLPCLFLMSCVFWLIAMGLERIRNERVRLAIFITVISAFLLLSYVNYYIFGIRKLPFGAETVVYQMPFFMVGCLLREKKIIEGFSARLRIFVGGALVVLGTLPLIWLDGRADPLHSVYGNLTLFYVFALISTIGYMLLFSLSTSRWLSYVGRNTLSILVMHKFPIVFCQLLVGDYMAEHGSADIVLTVVIAAVSLGLSLLVGHIIGLVFPLALGLPPKKSRRS